MVRKFWAIFLLVYLVIQTCATSTKADDFSVPDKAIQAAYCEGIMVGTIRQLTGEINGHCPFSADECRESTKIKSEVISSYRKKEIKISNYLALYENHDITTTNSLLNFTMIGMKDYDELQDKSGRCINGFGDKTDALRQCLSSVYEKTNRCNDFDPTNF